jgi:DNA-binding MarR family transcriptional regulator
MTHQNVESNQKTLTLLSDLCKVVRFCRRDSIFCENVTFTQFLILDAVSKSEKLRMAELHQILAVDKSTTTRLMNPLVRQGLVRREKSDHDLRAIDLTLTREGQEIHTRVWQCLAGFVDAIRTGIPEAKRTEVYGAVETFMGAVRNALSACQCEE